MVKHGRRLIGPVGWPEMLIAVSNEAGAF